ncbi:Major facilitator superfamily domain general substrate transporter [Penicillium hordei]|uniref:Major facilitator superfamily domain general substrate transporter n=1 Tax=Penicillium hordei TaxID=40994 RepID=A0AAD6DY72_9EURO|nr:Major facilitator superfamily domain general substrate transporter [Penicillium hordei]KAJ5597219.1 Major facilitator superfamily domain general substrate transporter [Penicillium hordei]
MHDDRTAELEKGSPTSLRPSSPAEPKSQAPGPPAAPEGGTKAYLSLLGGSLGLFISFGWVNCIALFQAEYETHQLKTYSSSEVSWITSSECESLLPQRAVKQQAHFNLVFFMLFMSPLSGYLFDNYEPRLPICIGGLIHVFGLMMTSLSSKYYQFYLAQSICSGTGTSLIFTPAMTSICPMTYFRKRRALAGGLTVAGSSLGGVIFPLMVNNLLLEVGFTWTMRICAFLILGLWAIAMLTISSNLPHTRKEFNLANYLRPFTEFNFLILLTFCFFLYCWTLEDVHRSQTSVHVGAVNADYTDIQNRDTEAMSKYNATGTARSILSNRVSYVFDLHGPSVTIDTACSSSLVALHQAMHSLRSGDCDSAIVGGVNLILDPAMFITKSKLSMLSAESRSRMWDQAANGYARGGGIAAMILKPLSQALQYGDPIQAIVRATGVNSDESKLSSAIPRAVRVWLES